jgi:hypothetical protein
MANSDPLPAGRRRAQSREGGVSMRHAAVTNL